ncbi:hypothetical protein [Photobacterium sanguinicancri]|uniref:hypothetical protein n=1 Tax=Photobacterium sanguinicancri TaxID=875932 RepID=UPI0021C452E5|nr:hypothetical protein [Photobacterium sanguinicancri]
MAEREEELTMTIRWQIPTWSVVATGLLMNIVSALMTNFYIEGETQAANTLTQQQIRNDKLIALTWQQVEAIDRKREYLLTLLVVSESNGHIISEYLSRFIRDDIQSWIDEPVEEISQDALPIIMDKLVKVQSLQRDKINQLYIENLTLIDSHAIKAKNISMLKSLALFLQIIGLGLVLARDLNRRDYKISP